MNDWCLEVWGDYACFTRPEMKVERVSYDIITPSAARAIYDAILWKEAIRWHISKIEVLNPIKWISVRRNEVKNIMRNPSQAQILGKVSPPSFFIEDERVQRAGLFLQDVRYRIYARFEFIPVQNRKYKHSENSTKNYADAEEQTSATRADENEAKYAAMFERRARKGQCFHRPYLGCREFACNFKLIDSTSEKILPIIETRDLGFMLYDINFENENDPMPLFFKAKIENGVVLIPSRNSAEVHG